MGHQNHHAFWAVHHKLGGCLTKPQSWVCKTTFYHQREAVYTSKGSSVYMIRSEQAEGHKLITWKSGQNAYGSHSATLLSLSLHLWPQLTTGISLVYRSVYTTCRDHPKVDSCSNTAPFWDIPQGQWWRKIPPLGRTSRCASRSLCLERQVVKVGDKGIWKRGISVW